MDLENVNDWDEVVEAYASRKEIEADSIDSGNLEVAECDDFVSYFVKDRSLDLEALIDCRDTDAPEDAKIAYLKWQGDWSGSKFRGSYRGDYSREREPRVAYATMLADDIYGVANLGPLEDYIDWEKFADDLFNSDYHEVDGYVFVVV